MQGAASDGFAAVLAAGKSDATYFFASLSARHAEGRDAEYIEWHSLDHRPEQYRLAGIRNSHRIVSTPECREVRAASAGEYDAVDHVMCYQFADAGSIEPFGRLSAALRSAERWSVSLPRVANVGGELAGKAVAPRVLIGADVVPWRPALGIYFVVERGHLPAGDLIDCPGVAGVWWYRGKALPAPFSTDSQGLQFTFCYLDDDPVAIGRLLRNRMRARWLGGGVEGLLAAPFFSVVPFDWSRHVPGR